MSIQVNPNANTINWDSLLSKLDAATKAAEAQAAGGVTAGQNITITTQVGGVEQSVTFPIPDDLDLPGEVDQAGIDSLCAKLASDPAYGLSEEEVKIIHEKLSEALAAAASSVSNTLAKGSTQVLFDLYKLMALLVEVGQKQRDASREMRTAQNLQVQKSILDQAEQQKSAAITGMWAGAICCFVQVVASIGMSISQGRAFNKQVKSLESSGVASAKENLSMLKAADTSAKASAQLQKVTNSVGGKSANMMGRTIAEDVGSYGFGNTDQAKAKLQLELTKTEQVRDKIATLNSKHGDGTLRSTDVPPGRLRDALVRKETFEAKLAQTGLSRQDVDRYIRTTNAIGRGEAGVSIQDRAWLLEPAQQNPAYREMGNMTSAEIKADVQAAVDARNAELNGELQTQIEAVDTARKNIQTAAKTDLQRYEDEYNSALREVNDIDKTTSSAEAKRLRDNLQLASDKLKFARAYAYNELAKPGVTTSAERAADIRLAGNAVDAADRGRMNDIGFIKASRTLQAGETRIGLINAVGNAAQGFIQNVTSYMQANAKKAEAENAKAQEQLEQTKDLFNQAQSLIDAVVQLMQAVSSAETQSMRDAIQA